MAFVGQSRTPAIVACYADLNGLYLQEKAFHDDTYSGTVYSAMDDSQNSVIGFVRQNEKEKVLVVFKLYTILIKDYTIGVPTPGQWVEVFNTDKEEYGGGGIVCTDPAFSSQECSILFSTIHYNRHTTTRCNILEKR